MRRHLLNLVTALSLLALVVILAAWARSYAPRDFTFGAYDGKLLLLFTDGQWTSFARPRENYTISLGDLWRMGQGQSTGDGSFLGVSYVGRPTKTVLGGGPGGNPGRFLMIAVPLAYPAALAAAAAALALAARVRLARRSRAGACPKCGYDLTGNVSGVCPECGNRKQNAE